MTDARDKVLWKPACSPVDSFAIPDCNVLNGCYNRLSFNSRTQKWVLSPPFSSELIMENLIRNELKRLQTKYDALTKSRDYFRRRCQILETIIANEAPHIVVPGGPTQQERYFEHYCHAVSGETTEIASAASFGEVIIDEIGRNSRLSSFGRRWSLCVLMFSFLLRMLGSKCYDYLRLVIPLPSKTTLMRHFAPSLSTWRAVLLDFTRVSEICRLFRMKYLV